MRVAGRDADAYLVVDGPVGAILIPGQPPLIKATASLRAHREFDDYDGPLPEWAPQGVASALARYREKWERP